MSSRRQVPAYFDLLVEAFRRGESRRFVHLGHWDSPPGPDLPPAPNEFADAQQRLDDLLLEMADLRDGQAVLDVGCGFGGSLDSVNRRFAGMKLTGVNVDPRQLGICRQLAPRGGNELRWVEDDACRLSFPDRSFDRLLCIEAMFHFPSRRGFFREAARVLRPGGVLVASDILVHASARRAGLPGSAIEAAIVDGYGPWPDFWCADADHGQLAQAAGLAPGRTIDATAQTLPSHRFTVPGNADENADPGDPAVRAGLALRWLHREGHLAYIYMRFDKPGRDETS